MKLRVLRGNPRIVVGHMHQRVGARGSRRVSVKAELAQSPADLVAQPVNQARPGVLSELPIENLAVCDRRAFEVLHFGNLGAALCRLGRRRRTGPKLARRGKHEKLPLHVVDPARITSSPNTRTDRTRPLRFLPVRLESPVRARGAGAAQIESSLWAARVDDTGYHAAFCRFLRGLSEALCVSGEEVRKDH